jgi:hypothetical protein
MDKPKPKKRPRPTQDECLEWLRTYHPELYIQATRERDWIWIRGSQQHQQLGAIDGKYLASLKTYGFRAKKEGTHKLSDGDEAVWYHSCQGVWRPTYNNNNKRYKRGYRSSNVNEALADSAKRFKEKEKSMSKGDALKFAQLL